MLYFCSLSNLIEIYLWSFEFEPKPIAPKGPAPTWVHQENFSKTV